MSNAYVYTNIQTTGGRCHDLVELGGFVEYNKEIVTEFNYIIRPEELITRRASELHGIYRVSVIYNSTKVMWPRGHLIRLEVERAKIFVAQTNTEP